MADLISSQALIYERANGVVYARFRDPPHNTIPRWIVGGGSKGQVLSYNDWHKINKLAKTNPILKKQIAKLLELYFLIRDTE